MKGLRGLFFVLGLMALIACENRDSTASRETSASGFALSITDIPSGVLCIIGEVTATGYSEAMAVDVTGTEVEMTFYDIPVGTAEISVNAYNTACSHVATGTQAAWIGSDTVEIAGGIILEAEVQLIPVGGVDVTVQWEDAPLTGDLVWAKSAGGTDADLGYAIISAAMSLRCRTAPLSPRDGFPEQRFSAPVKPMRPPSPQRGKGIFSSPSSHCR